MCQQLFLIPNPYSLIPEPHPDKSEFDIGDGSFVMFSIFLSWKGDSKNRPRCQVYLRFLFIQAIEAIVGIPIGHTSMQDRAFEQFLPKCAP